MQSTVKIGKIEKDKPYSKVRLGLASLLGTAIGVLDLVVLAGFTIQD